MRGEHSGSGRNRQERNRGAQGNTGGRGNEQADGFGQDEWQERFRQRAQGGRGPGAPDWNYGAQNLDEDEQNSTGSRERYDRQQGGQRGGGFGGYGQSGYNDGAFGGGQNGGRQGSTGMGAFGENDFQGGTGGMNARGGQSGYGQGGNMRGGYGQGSGFAQSSGMGGYGQGASAQGGWGQSGADQHSDERYGQHFGQGGGQNEQRSSPYGYGGQGSQQPGAQDMYGSRYPGGQQQGGQPRGQHHGKGPKGYQRSDERIREDVSEHLYHDHDVDASEIEITVSGGEVTLTGTVHSREEKRRAEECAERCTGVKDVLNQLRVQSGSGASSPQGSSQRGGMSGQQQGEKGEGAQQPRTSVSTGA